MSTPEHRPEAIRPPRNYVAGHNHSATDIGLDGRRFAVRYDSGCAGCEAERPEWVKRARAGTLPCKDLTYKA